MQGDKITKRILDDAVAKANSIVDEAKLQAEETLGKANSFAKTKQEEMLKKVGDYKISAAEKYNTLLKIEGNKILLKTKQNVLEKLKQKAIEDILNLRKEDMLKFLANLIKQYANKDETLKFNIKKITKEDVTSLDVVKKLNLKVEKLNEDEEGLVLSNASFDKNLLFSTLVNSAFEEKEDEISKILF